MKTKVMDIDIHWERIKKEQLAYLLEKNNQNDAGPVLTVSGSDPTETMLKTLVQQAAHN